MERLIKKLSMTCRSHLDEETDKHKQKELQEKINGKVGRPEYSSGVRGALYLYWPSVVKFHYFVVLQKFKEFICYTEKVQILFPGFPYLFIE